MSGENESAFREFREFLDNVGAHYRKTDEVLDRFSAVLAHSRWTPLFYLVVAVLFFWLGLKF